MKDEEWIKLANKHLKGKTIREIKRLDNKYLKDIGWEDHRAIQIIFTDGHWITPSIDEEFLLKSPPVDINKVITDAWYKWQKKTRRSSLPGTHIHGNVCVIQKVQDDAA